MEKHPDHCYCDECKRTLNQWAQKHGIYIYTPEGMLIAQSTREHEQEWLDKGFLVAYMRLSLPEPFEFEILHPDYCPHCEVEFNKHVTQAVDRLL